MLTLAIFFLIISQIIGFICIFLTSFGTFIIFFGIFSFAWMTKFKILSFGAMGIFFALYVLGEVLEFVLTALGAKAAGASGYAIWGALLGGIIGAVLGTALLGVGVIIGTFLGIFLGAFLVELLGRQGMRRALMAGAGSLLGRLGSIIVKLMIALIMMVFMGIHFFYYFQANGAVA